MKIKEIKKALADAIIASSKGQMKSEDCLNMVRSTNQLVRVMAEERLTAKSQVAMGRQAAQLGELEI